MLGVAVAGDPGVMFSTTAASACEATSVRLELEADDSSSTSLRPRHRRRPLAAHCRQQVQHRRPDVASHAQGPRPPRTISAAIAVTVLLPLVPVMATRGASAQTCACAANSVDVAERPARRAHARAMHEGLRAAARRARCDHVAAVRSLGTSQHQPAAAELSARLHAGHRRWMRRPAPRRREAVA
jgi:hypothetical protein